MRHPDRLERAFAFAANYDTNGTLDVSKSPVFSEYLSRAETVYNRINPAADYARLHDAIFTMWQTLPAWNQQSFTSVPARVQRRVWIVDADHEEAVNLAQWRDMQRWMPDASGNLLPAVSHFAFLQDPFLFNRGIEDLLSVPLP